jgi:ubiquinone/menaquinone biosynthesis C-methylase UbiE
LKTGKLPEINGDLESWRNNESENRNFVRAMYDLGWMTAQSVVEIIDLTGVAHVVDLGAGPGHYSIAMLERYPRLRATLVDLPLSLLVARDSFKRRNIHERVDFRACDLYAPDADIPVPRESVQFVLISHVLHMEAADQNQRLIRNAAALLSPGGRLLIHDMFLEEDGAHPQMSSLFAVHMLAMTQRGELYPPSTICSWLEEAGLRASVLSKSPFLVEGVRSP